MKNKVFVDTGGWIALMNEKDEHHASAREYFFELRKQSVPFVTSNYVISETLTWLNYNNLHAHAVKTRELWQKAEKSNLLSIHWVDEKIAEEAWQIFQNFSDHVLSFTDCTSFAICRKEQIEKVFGFDKHFNILGFLLSPYQIHEHRTTYDIIQPGE